jgi:hypothetical protein
MSNALELFNESCLLIMSYHLLFFTDYVLDDPYIQYDIGFSVICIMSLNIIVNMALILKESVHNIVINIKKCRNLMK